MSSLNENIKRPRFIETLGPRKIRCHGRITEAEHHDVFYSKLHKTVNSLFRGEPYQFGHQTSEYVVRVEELAGGYMARSMDFFVFGNYMGRIHPGDEVIITAAERGGRFVAGSVFNVSTNSDLKPGLQIPGAVIRFLFVLLLLLIVGTVLLGYEFVASGQIYSFILPAVLIGAVFSRLKKIKRKLFGGR